MKNALRLAAASFFVSALAMSLARDAYGQAMSSSHYKVESDSLNFGGVRSTSGSFTIEDTLGESATGLSSSTNYTMQAGYQQMQTVYIAITSASNVTMSPSLGGVTGGTSNGSTNFTVTTDDIAGYTGTIAASTSPALQSSIDSFADYVPATSNPDFTFTNAAASSSFAFTPQGTDIATRYKDDGVSACGTGSSDTANACWDGLSTSATTFLNRTSANQPSGTVITLNFRAAVGTSRIQKDGSYVATSTITVMPL